MESINLTPLITIPNLRTEPLPPSEFEHGVAGELRALAEQLEAGTMHIQHFSLTISDDGQKMEVEVR